MLYFADLLWKFCLARFLFCLTNMPTTVSAGLISWSPTSRALLEIQKKKFLLEFWLENSLRFLSNMSKIPV